MATQATTDAQAEKDAKEQQRLAAQATRAAAKEAKVAAEVEFIHWLNIGAGAIRRRALSSLHTAVPSVAQQCTAQLAMRRRVEDRRAEHSDRAAASLGGGSVLRAFISKAPAPRPTGVGPRAHNHLTTLALASTQRPRTHRRYHPPPRIACYAGVRPRTSATGATGERTQSCTDLRRAQANVSHALPQARA